jgi:predicted phage tail component-like protein
MFDIEYNGLRASDLGVKVAQRPNIPAPELKVSEIEIAGRDGALIQSEGTYQNIEFEIEMNYITHPDRWGATYRTVKDWLLSSGNRRLIFTDDGSCFYKVKNVVVGENERESKEAGIITPSFLCDPFTYLVSGLSARRLDEITYNPYYTSCPTYLIKGEGICALDINGKTLAVNVGQNAVIDTDLMLAYRQDGTLINAQVYGYYEDGRLKPGKVELFASDGFDVTIIPNWRCL